MRPHNIKKLLPDIGHHYLSEEVAYRMGKDSEKRLVSVIHKEQQQEQQNKTKDQENKQFY